MGLKDLLSRWTKSEDERAVERAKDEARMTPHERDVDREDYEARKEDTQLGRDFAASEALEAADED
jgi:hypothetical protein